jgi:hypothetical protein
LVAGAVAINLLTVPRAVLVAVAGLGTPVRLPPEVLAHQAKVMLVVVRRRALHTTNQAVAVVLVQLALTHLLQLWVPVAMVSPHQSQGHRSHAQVAVVEAVVSIVAPELLEVQAEVVLAAVQARQEPQTPVVVGAALAVAVLLVAQVARVLSSSQSQLPITPAQPQVRLRLRPAAPTQFFNLIHQGLT